MSNKKADVYQENYGGHFINNLEQNLISQDAFSCAWDHKQKEIKFISNNLDSILGSLDTLLGDTDPYIPRDYGDEDVMEEFPIFWTMQKISKLKNKIKRME